MNNAPGTSWDSLLASTSIHTFVSVVTTVSQVLFHSWLYLHETLGDIFQEQHLLQMLINQMFHLHILIFIMWGKKQFNMFYMRTVPLPYIQSINYNSRKKQK